MSMGRLVRLFPERTYAKLGARQWEVEWQTVKPKALIRIAANEAKDLLDEVDPDNDLIWHRTYFKPCDKGLARDYARLIAPHSAYGQASLQEQVVVLIDEDQPGVGEWENVGETEYEP